MRISENMLLDGHTGLTCGGSIISRVKGMRIVWNYRRTFDGASTVTDDRDEADMITLEDDRDGVIQLARRLTAAQGEAASRVESGYQQLWGDEVH